MATSDVRAEQRTVIQFCFESGMTTLDTIKKVKHGEHHRYASLALVSKLSRFCEGKPAAELMGRPSHRNTGNAKKVKSAVSNDRRHTVRDLAEIIG